MEEEHDPDRVMDRLNVGATLSENGYGDVLVLSREVVDRVHSAAAYEILEALDDSPAPSLQALADRVGRDPANVSRVVDMLTEEDCVEKTREGKATRISLAHDTILVEPLITPD